MAPREGLTVFEGLAGSDPNKARVAYGNISAPERAVDRGDLQENSSKLRSPGPPPFLPRVPKPIL
jgi:hypothetical protein